MKFYKFLFPFFSVDLIRLNIRNLIGQIEIFEYSIKTGICQLREVLNVTNCIYFGTKNISKKKNSFDLFKLIWLDFKTVGGGIFDFEWLLVHPFYYAEPWSELP